MKVFRCVLDYAYLRTGFGKLQNESALLWEIENGAIKEDISPSIK
jgi:hypothetical protein